MKNMYDSPKRIFSSITYSKVMTSNEIGKNVLKINNINTNNSLTSNNNVTCS